MSSKQVSVVTGANGYIASHIVKQLLEEGVEVIGTVRSFNKAANLISKFPTQFKSGQLKFVEVDFNDIESIRGIFKKYHTITRFIHPAQNFGKGTKTGEEFDKEVIQYTSDSLDAIINVVEESDSPIERFVYFSSSVAVRGTTVDYSKIFTEKDFPDLSHDDALKDWLSAYAYAKVQGEKKVLGYKSKRGIQYKVIVPPTVIGPPVSIWEDNKSFDSNNAHLYSVFKGQPPARGVEWYADVRNIADAAVQASDKNKTPGILNNRYVIVDGTENYYDAVPILLENFKNKDPGTWADLIAKGKEVNKDRVISKRDLSITDTEINHKKITFQQTVVDTVQLILELEKK